MDLHNYLADRRRMKAFIGLRTPEPGTRVVIAQGEGDDIWADIYPVWDGDEGWDLHFETNCPEAVGVREIYEHLRRQEMTWWEWERELASATRVTARVVQVGEVLPSPMPFDERLYTV